MENQMENKMENQIVNKMKNQVENQEEDQMENHMNRMEKLEEMVRILEESPFVPSPDHVVIHPCPKSVLKYLQPQAAPQSKDIMGELKAQMSKFIFEGQPFCFPQNIDSDDLKILEEQLFNNSCV